MTSWGRRALYASARTLLGMVDPAPLASLAFIGTVIHALFSD
jgi:hypothetical protein